MRYGGGSIGSFVDKSLDKDNHHESVNIELKMHLAMNDSMLSGKQTKVYYKEVKQSPRYPQFPVLKDQRSQFDNDSYQSLQRMGMQIPSMSLNLNSKKLKASYSNMKASILEGRFIKNSRVMDGQGRSIDMKARHQKQSEQVFAAALQVSKRMPP